MDLDEYLLLIDEERESRPAEARLADEIQWLRCGLRQILEFGEGVALAIADEALGHTVHGQWMGRESPER